MNYFDFKEKYVDHSEPSFLLNSCLAIEGLVKDARHLEWILGNSLCNKLGLQYIEVPNGYKKKRKRDKDLKIRGIKITSSAIRKWNEDDRPKGFVMLNPCGGVASPDLLLASIFTGPIFVECKYCIGRSPSFIFNDTLPHLESNWYYAFYISGRKEMYLVRENKLWRGMTKERVKEITKQAENVAFRERKTVAIEATDINLRMRRFSGI